MGSLSLTLLIETGVIDKKVGHSEYRMQIAPACGRQGLRNYPYPIGQESV